MSTQVVISILISLGVNEFLGITDWLAERIVRLAARRWEAQTGFDHLDDWLEDLEHSPGRLLRVFTASWLLLGTFVDKERLTLNLPSLWRLSRPLRAAVLTAFTAVRDRGRGSLRPRSQAGSSPGPVSRLAEIVIGFVVLLLPRQAREEYREALLGDLYEVPPRSQLRFALLVVVAAPRLAFEMRSLPPK